ncbi:signal peptidase I [Arthrobacter sp. AOP36-C1-22]|uniref:signal peptidase I n=1 Tax=Arthrobacter sp. AOP36-C1-22 TaxID=3457683 RepID=UPI0040346006
MAQHAASRTTAQGSTAALLGRALSFVALVLAVLAAAVLIVVPMATGSQTYSVLTNSMRPHLPPGTLLISRPAAFGDLSVGDVITYQLESGQADVITHRIVSTSADQQGNTLLITQGDNNSLPDEEPVREVQVRGKLFYAVPYAGFLANWLGNQDRGLGAQIAALALISYGAWNVVGGVLTRRRKSRIPAEDTGPQALLANEALPASDVSIESTVSLGHSWHELGSRSTARSPNASYSTDGPRPRGRRRQERVSR